MEGGSAGREEILRQFEEAVSGMELDDLRRLASDLMMAGLDERSPKRPHLRRPPRDEVVRYRVRVDLDGARPPIWRRLDLRSDLTLDIVHRVLQAAFGWWDYHLHRFSLGGGPWDPESEFFLCPFDVEEGEDEGTPEFEVRLDETLQEPGDVLAYLYDYGDSWELTIRLEQVLPWEEGAPAALCVDGRRAAPPEDCGHLTSAEELAEVLDDPAHFDVDEVNVSLNDPFLILRDRGVSAPLVDLVNRLVGTEIGDDLAARLFLLTQPVEELTREEKAAALKPFMWFLERARGEGFELTSAGYLKPADVEEACRVVPAMRGWIGKNNREANAYPLLEFREALRKHKLVRKYKGRLRLAKTAEPIVGDPDALWDYLASRLIPDGSDRFDQQATLLMLAYLATSDDGALQLELVTETLSHLGWRYTDGRPVEWSDLFDLEPNPLHLLWNIGEPPPRRSQSVSLEAAALARTALLLGER